MARRRAAFWTIDGARDSAHPLRLLFDAAARGYSVRLSCRGCGHGAVLDAHALWHHCRRFGRSEWLRDLPAQCVCGVCGRREPELLLVHDEPTDRSLPMPSAQAWKRELSRHR